MLSKQRLARSDRRTRVNLSTFDSFIAKADADQKFCRREKFRKSLRTVDLNYDRASFDFDPSFASTTSTTTTSTTTSMKRLPPPPPVFFAQKSFYFKSLVIYLFIFSDLSTR